MALDVENPNFSIGVVGAGTMGRGIAQIAAAAGVVVTLFDERAETAEEAVAFNARMLKRAAEKDQMSEVEAEAAIARTSVAAGLGELAGAGLVIEAVIEDLETKRGLFRALEELVAAECILATNTSSLSVTAIAASCARPERVAGMHFFNPVPLMKLVEVVSGLRTKPEVADALIALVRRLGHRAVAVADSPGFLVNNAGRALYTEGARIVAEGIADFAGVDAILREGGAGFRMGPFELMDLTGLDVSHPAMEAIYDEFYHEPRFQPQPLTRQRWMGGSIGRKSGSGFYDYADGEKVLPGEAPPPDSRPQSVWLSSRFPDGRVALSALVGAAGVVVDEGARPGPNAICLLATLGEDATTAALAEGLEAERCMAVDTLFGLEGRRTLMTTPVTDPDLRDQAHGLLASDGSQVTVIHDSPGFIAQRIAAAIVNTGADIAQRRLAAPGDIDDAVRLGLGYPMGPLALGDMLGPARVLAILEAMHTFYREPRYRPSPWLFRRARLGVSLLTPEG